MRRCQDSFGLMLMRRLEPGGAEMAERRVAVA